MRKTASEKTSKEKEREEKKLIQGEKKSIFRGKIMNLKPKDKGLLFSISRHSKKI